MKTIYKQLLLLLLLLPFSLLAQGTLNGTVKEQSSGLPLPGVNILFQGTNKGISTGMDGEFTLPSLKKGDVLIFSYIGFKDYVFTYNDQATIVVALEEDSALLDEIVVIGYGTVKKKDATGSVELITAKDLNKGAIVSADQMLNGKSSGVRIVSGGGAPDSKVDIRIRGGASLSASNSPLIVIDGIPISNSSPAGQANPLALVNPNDIESFSILKDASATAIYGSRASNGVIIITTKKGNNGATKFNFSSNTQIGKMTKKLDVLSSSEFVNFINTRYPDQKQYLGVNGVIYDTDWQDEIYRTSISSDNNFSALTSLFGNTPLRASIGHSNIEGILRGSQLKKYTASVNVNPKFFDDHLKVNINAKGVMTRKDQPDEGAIGSALSLNPTLPVYDPSGNNRFGGYYQALDPKANFIKTAGATNAVAQLKQRERNENVDRFLGNIEFDYKLHFLPELRAILNLGLDYSKSKINESLASNAIAAYNNFESNPLFNSGKTLGENQTKKDKTLDAYFAYTKSFDGIIQKLDAQGGYSYQNFNNQGFKYPTQINDQGVRVPSKAFQYYNDLNLQSFFGRINLDITDKYLLTVSYRADASSLFAPGKNRWGHFPSAAAAWKMTEESWLKDSKVITSLKLRVGAGITGQQDITGSAGYYPYQALYLGGDPTVQYQFGDEYYITYRADAYNPKLTWEKTVTYNAGFDFDLWNGILDGTLDYYHRDTKDLLAIVPQSEGSLSNRFVDNVGKTKSDGVELGLNFTPVKTDNLTISFSGNISFNETYVTDLNNVSQVAAPDTGIGRGTGINIGYFAVGERSRNFWLFDQLYDTNGNPIQGAFVDKNGDGIINDKDRIYVPYDPKWNYGFGTTINYKNFDFTANFRGQLGGKIYDVNKLNKGYSDSAIPTQGGGFLNNVLDLYNGDTYTGFTTNPNDYQSLSNYYVSDATFLRLDNITLGYKFNTFFTDSMSLRVYGSVNNVFVITNYKGLDPENFTGIEQSPYARPRVYTFGINLDF